MTQHVKLKKIHLSSDEVLDVARGVTVIVGPNNTGKSSLLRELNAQSTLHRNAWVTRSHKVVDHPEYAFSGGVEDLIEELSRIHERRSAGQYSDGSSFHEDNFRLLNGTILPLSEVHGHWGSDQGLGPLGAYVVTYLNAESRLALTSSTSSFDTSLAAPSMPLQVLYMRRDLEQRINDLVSRAFKVGITVDRYAGSMIHLHAGAVAEIETTPPQSSAYMSQLKALPMLHDQGDGVRAFTGMVMSILTGQSPVVLIDEPEAFLHPPQARQFGRFLAEYASSDDGVQVIIATHSEDIVAGLTSVASATDRISIARLTRDGDRNHVAQLTSETVKELYADPLMKHYDMLNGLFTTGVVLCEADSDCTYFRAVLDTPGHANIDLAREAHFTHAGGKSRIARAIRAFRSTAIPCAAIFDIDILQNDGEFNALIESIGADASVSTPLRNVVVDAVRGHGTPLRRSALRHEIDEILARSTSTNLARGDAREIQEAAAQKTGWKILKTSGKTLLTGGALTAFESLRAHLESHGVFIVEQGELERLHPEVPQNDKAKWLRTVIENGAYQSSPSIEMLKRISAFLDAEQTRVEVGEVPTA